MIKPLLRTIPLYSGNVKISCTLSDYSTNDDINYDCYVRGAVLSPLSHNIYDKKIEANLLSSDYSYDLKEFYKYYSDVFYSNGFTFSKVNVPSIDIHNPVYDRNLDLEYGCSRSSNNQLEFYAPIYIDSINDIPDAFVITIEFKKGNKNVSKKIRVKIGEDLDSKRNYLRNYVKSYVNKIDSKVANLSSSIGKATFSGIDVINGGIANSTSNLMGQLTSTMNTMNLFDLALASQFSQSKLVMKQVLPLCYSFNLDSILTNQQNHEFKCTQVKISGYYEKNNIHIPMYDWSSDYTRFSHKIKRMDQNTGVMNIVSGLLSNIMDDSYPSLAENRMQEYIWSSKLSKMYSRWKMYESTDDYPYITNMSFTFSRNQNSNYAYREFPSSTSSMIGLAVPVSSSLSNISKDYSLIFPFGKTKENYYDRFSSIVDLYEYQMNNYGYDWFDVVEIDNDNLDWISDVKWSDVNNDKCYYRGILHDLGKLYSKVNNIKNFKSLDKFAIVFNPIVDIKTSTVIDNIKKSNYVVKTTVSNDYVANSDYNKSMISSMMYSNDQTKASCEMFLSTNPSEYSLNAEVSVNTSFMKMSNDKMTYTYEHNGVMYSYVPDMTSTAFLNINDLGFTIDDVNTWYNYSDFVNVFSYCGKQITNEDIRQHSKLNEVSDATIEYAKSIFNKEELVSLVNNTLDDTSTYICSSYEILPLHTMSLLVDSYTYVDDEGKESIQWSYLKFNGPLSYISYNYGIKLHYSNEPDYSNDEWVYGKDHRRYVYNPRYDEETTYKICNNDKEFLKSKLIEENISNDVDGFSNDLKTYYYYYWTQYSDWTSYQSPIVKNLYMSSTLDKTIRHNVGVTYWKDSYGIGHSYSYISFTPTSLITTPYGFNLYRKSDFISERWIKELATKDFDQLTYYEVSLSQTNGFNKEYDLSYINKEGESAYNLKKCVSSLFTLIHDNILKSLENKSKYTFYPVLYGDASIYANNVFVKKDSQKKFYGDKIKKKNLDKDIDFVWCDAYNFRKILEKYKFSDDYVNSIRKSIKKKAKARFLDKDHLYWWYNELHKNFDYIDEGNIDFDWYDRIYVKNRKLTSDDDGNLQVIDCYNKLSSIHGMEEYVENEDGKKEKNILRRFNYFFDRIEQRTSDGLWQFRESSKDDYSETIYDLTFDIDVILLDNDIMNKIINITGSEDKYRDLYLYTIEDIDDFERKISSGELSALKYDNTYNDIQKPVGHLLVPLFDDIYVQDKVDTQIYAHYLLHDLSEISIEDDPNNRKLYRYNMPDISWIIEVSSTEIDVLSKPYKSPIMSKDGSYVWQPTLIEYILDPSHEHPFEYSMSNLLYFDYNSVNMKLNNHDLDMLDYKIDNFCTVEKDNIHYGCWIIDISLDNTSNAMNILSQYDLSTNDTRHQYSYDNTIKWIRYVNGIDITLNPKYCIKSLRQVMPFLKKQPFDMLSKINTVLYPDHYSLYCRYSQSLASKPDINTSVEEVNVSISDNSSSSMITLYRYFGNIVPLITKASSVPDQWLLKFKEVNDNIIPIVNTGNYPSIGDCVIYCSSLSTSNRNKYQVYKVSNDANIKDYNNLVYETSTIEQKHFNDSVVVLLDNNLEWTSRTLVGMQEVKELETDEKKKEIFRMLYSGTNMNTLTEDEFLFLFNRYNSQVTSVPIKLNGERTSKLYKVTYKYYLK